MSNKKNSKLDTYFKNVENKKYTPSLNTIDEDLKIDNNLQINITEYSDNNNKNDTSNINKIKNIILEETDNIENNNTLKLGTIIEEEDDDIFDFQNNEICNNNILIDKNIDNEILDFNTNELNNNINDLDDSNINDLDDTNINNLDDSNQILKNKKNEDKSHEDNNDEPIIYEKTEKNNYLLDKLNKELIEDFNKFDEREKNKVQQINLLIKIFSILGYNITELNDLTDITIYREKLINKKITDKLLELVPELKKVYNTGYLNCLHDNSIYKQKFPAINLIRQILKCNYMKLVPKIISNGYEKLSGKKKTIRLFVIEKIIY